jgi:hypothetical protein
MGEDEFAVNKTQYSPKVYPLIWMIHTDLHFIFVCQKMDMNCNLILQTLSNNTWIHTRSTHYMLNLQPTAR